MKSSKENLTILSCILLNFLCVKSFAVIGENEKCSSIINCAFKNLTKSIANKQREISIVNFGSDKKIINSIVQKDSNLSYKIKDMEQVVGTKRHEINESAIVLFDNIKDLSEFNIKAKFTNRGPKSFQFFIFIPDTTINEISSSITETKINNYNMKNVNEIRFRFRDVSEISHFQYFLVDESEFMKLFTFVWYTSTACGKKQIVEVNRFDKKSKKWKNSKFDVKKFVNFHGCTLSVLAHFIPGEFEKNQGSLYSILLVLAQTLNFKIDLAIWGQNYDSVVKPFKNKQINLIIFTACLPTTRIILNIADDHHVTRPFFSSVDHLIVPLGEEYSGYEKLNFPFDSPTWFLIGLTFFTAFLTIIIVSFMSLKAQDYIFGNNVTSPTLHIFIQFFGLGQVVLPKRNFPRFLLMIFILFSLIIRTAYQGKLFEFLQKEMRKPEVQSIEEMIEKNFTFHMHQCDGSKYWQQVDKNWCGLPRR
jgi:hypothetical protein